MGKIKIHPGCGMPVSDEDFMHHELGDCPGKGGGGMTHCMLCNAIIKDTAEVCEHPFDLEY